MNDNSILVAWARKSKNGDKIVLSMDRDALIDCKKIDGKVKIVCNLGKMIDLLSDEVEVLAVNHLKTSKFEMKEIKINYRGE